MASDAAKTHPWHLVEPSPWPIMGGISAFVTAVGAIIFMHTDFAWLMVLGFVLILIVFWGWLRDVIAEAEAGTYHSALVQKGLRIGMILFITSEVMFFFAFFWAYFHSSLPILNNVAGTWPNGDLKAIGASGIPMLNTLILLSSSVTVTIAHHAILENRRPKAVMWTAITFILGIIFLGFQGFEYGELILHSFKITDGIYPSTFFMATGFHGFHVLLGTCFLIVCFFRLRAGHFKPDQHVGFEAAAWYWHFVDVVWVFLYINVYFWGASSFGHVAAG
ncbi:MAG: cytochrome c oxidase subunit 3 [Rhodospirillales bacterium]|jgi:cytochrome c oxidase subunit 3|nr:cytochrome c oxidase subunit 3 [Rhodospirillaceae bacterium]MDP6430052.1 cytochrome c oxidase subunit 3 [Rhodospirillales bacterium]MDP6642727.1 cytochrome c oxidase subunit 3 [Rhodospirillales bacterium]MDP6843252.1 cytochrome c oxidase subunit 3 [Rhodospirillales bacterium]|tara:strand:+ start:618 stop:1448 length:831 start_codon:yes stop_codon:yes gene_type:complete